MVRHCKSAEVLNVLNDQVIPLLRLRMCLLYVHVLYSLSPLDICYTVLPIVILPVTPSLCCHWFPGFSIFIQQRYPVPSPPIRDLHHVQESPRHVTHQSSHLQMCLLPVCFVMCYLFCVGLCRVFHVLPMFVPFCTTLRYRDR